MKASKTTIFLFGLFVTMGYGLICRFAFVYAKTEVSFTFIFILPIFLGAIPVLFIPKEELKSNKLYLFLSFVGICAFFAFCYLGGIEGLICILIISFPFWIFGLIGFLLFRLAKVLTKKSDVDKKYFPIFLFPLAFMGIETRIQTPAQEYTVSTSIEIHADKQTVWDNTKNVKNIQPKEIEPHFIHWIGVPKPLNGELDKEGVGGVRHITWEKGIQFQEKITSWGENTGFSYDILVDPKSIPDDTLDEHVKVGGRYFSVLKGSYHIDQLSDKRQKLTLTCTYKLTTNLNFYGKLWTDFFLEDFNETVLEIIKKRSENPDR